jgi:hypothetical protein
MKKYFKYFWYIVKHKWYVGIFCFKEGLYWRGIFHDMHKLRPFPFWAYANYFYGKNHEIKGKSETGYSKPSKTCDPNFDKAWLFHQKTQKHHYQFWILLEDCGITKLIPMDEKYWKEMICDWYGASIATGHANFTNYKENTRKWYLAHRPIIKISNDTRKSIEKMMGIDLHLEED